MPVFHNQLPDFEKIMDDKDFEKVSRIYFKIGQLVAKILSAWVFYVETI